MDLTPCQPLSLHVVLTLLVRRTQSLREAIDAVRWSNASNWSDLTARKSAYGKPRKNSLIRTPTHDQSVGPRLAIAIARIMVSISRRTSARSIALVSLL